MSYCTTVKLPDGTLARVRMTGRRPKGPPCCGCGEESTLLCDGEMQSDPFSPGKTCDVPICPACATSIGPDKDLCPGCAQ